jgi:hypothetical protein
VRALGRLAEAFLDPLRRSKPVCVASPCMSLQVRRHPRCDSVVMAVRLGLVPLPVLLFLFFLLTALSTQAYVPPHGRRPLFLPSVRPPRLNSFLRLQPSLFPRWPLCPTNQRSVHSTKRWSKKQQQDTPPQQKQSALENLERRLKGHGGDKSPVPFAYVTQTPKGNVSFPFP